MSIVGGFPSKRVDFITVKPPYRPSGRVWIIIANYAQFPEGYIFPIRISCIFSYNTLEWTIAKKAKYKYFQCSSNIEKNYYIWHLMDQSVARSSLHNRKRKNEKSLGLNSQWFPFLVNIAGGSWIGCTILFSQDGLILASFIFVFLLTSTSSWSTVSLLHKNAYECCRLIWFQVKIFQPRLIPNF